MKKIYLFTLILIITSFNIAIAQNYPSFNPIKVDQFGYLPNAEKVAVISDPMIGYNSNESYTAGSTLEVRDAVSNTVVFSGASSSWNNGQTHSQSGDRVWWFDFSSVQTPGSYYVFDPSTNTSSYTFDIRDDVYNEVLKQAVRSFYYQRCGVSKTQSHGGVWNDTPCHIGASQDLDCRLVTNPTANTSRDLSGGWHDAGDYNKYVQFTIDPIHDLLFAFQKNPSIWGDDYNIPESGNGVPDIIDEIKFELDWLIKMQNANGSVLTKVSVDGFQAASPCSADSAPRYYGTESVSATLCVASTFAHAYQVITENNITSLQSYANDLLVRAEDAWAWADANSSLAPYNNAGFSSANPEVQTITNDEFKVGAAVSLFAATGSTTYKNYVDNNYTIVRPYQWDYWFAFGKSIQQLLLHYTSLPNATASVSNNILNSFTISHSSNNGDLYSAYINETDAYRAQLSDNDHTWGSSKWKCVMGILLLEAVDNDIDPANNANILNAANGYINYMHGVNPNDIVYLSNMYDYGAEHSANEFYHSWFFDGTVYDNVFNSSIGPAPGFVTGGVNVHFEPTVFQYYGTVISPPMNQPAQKCYLDWNTSWPEDSWAITENAIYYQSSYIHLLSSFASAACSSTATINGLPSIITDGNAVNLSATPSGGTFSGNGVVFNAFNPSISGTGPSTVSYIFTDANGCTSTTSQVVIVGSISYNFVNYNLGTISP